MKSLKFDKNPDKNHKHKKTRKRIVYGLFWRSRRDSNPGAREGKRFSSFFMTRKMP